MLYIILYLTISQQNIHLHVAAAGAGKKNERCLKLRVATTAVLQSRCPRQQLFYSSCQEEHHSPGSHISQSRADSVQYSIVLVLNIHLVPTNGSRL